VVQIPDSLRQQLAPVLKHHFWILAALVPLLLIPALFMAAADRREVISRERATIDGRVSALEAVRNTADHPNAAWSEAFDRQAAAVREELLGEWKAFWESQQPLRVWPEELGPDFLASIAAVESGSRKDLLFRDQQRYQNTVAEIVRQLPARMGCEELMVAEDGQAVGGLEFGGQRPPLLGRPLGMGPGEDAEATRSRDVLVWRPEDQKRLLESFTWNKPPSTTKVRLAQEELWVYGLFCDAIRRINEGSTALFDARITTVEELAVGYPAAEDQPGGQGTGRVIADRRPAVAPGVSGFEDALLAGEPGQGMPGEQLQSRPPHPRFSGGEEGLEAAVPRSFAPLPGLGEGPDGEETGPSLTPDDMLKQWIYVDFNGRPLMAPELATAPDAQLVHLMPFVMRLVMDQRQIDRLLADLAASPVPIDVRQVRINPSARGAGGEGVFGGPRDGGFETPAGGGGQSERRRPFDVIVELRGTVGLATPPNPAAVGGGSEQAAVADGGDA
jgi:hypothetical protein